LICLTDLLYKAGYAAVIARQKDKKNCHIVQKLKWDASLAFIGLDLIGLNYWWTGHRNARPLAVTKYICIVPATIRTIVHSV